MKFYKDKSINNDYYLKTIFFKKLTVIYYDSYCSIIFFKNGKQHNTKNASYIDKYGYKQFRLNGKWCSMDKIFDKESWRAFVKMQVFL
jgi:hypothetical protein